MAVSTRTIHATKLGQVLTFLETAEDTGGERLVLGIELAPGRGVVEHIHAHQDERFTVLHGTLGVKVDGRTTHCAQGETAEAPMGSAHRFFNPTTRPVRLTAELQPALELEQLLDKLYTLAAQGKTTRSGLPNPLQLGVLVDTYQREFLYLPRIPVAVQRAMWKPWAIVGRRLGFRAVV
jgi:mannose-6-phosphate isomerase-like protein (cupin superfamily)